jgi:hypothetical protein
LRWCCAFVHKADVSALYVSWLKLLEKRRTGKKKGYLQRRSFWFCLSDFGGRMVSGFPM